MIELTCCNCGKVFKGYPGRLRKAKQFCSVECRTGGQKVEKIKAKCKTCGKDFSFWPSKKRKFCSWDCWINGSRKPKVAIVCKNCGKEFTTSRPQVCCSHSCSSELLKEKRKFIKVKGEKISSCYLKEAEAMRKGLHWEGKNKCAELPEESQNLIVKSSTPGRKCGKCGALISSSQSRKAGLCYKCDMRTHGATVHATANGKSYVDEVREYMRKHLNATFFDVALELHYSNAQARRLMKKAEAL